MKLSAIELRIIDWVIADNSGKESPLLRQPPLLRFTERHSTGKGYFLLFDPLPQRALAARISKVTSAALSTNLPPPRHVVGFTLFIKNGQMTSFEGYTFGSEDWPADAMENWLVFDKVEATGQEAK